MRARPSPEPIKEVLMPKSKAAGLTRRQMLKVGGAATFAGYAVGVEKALGQVIKTDTQGIVSAVPRKQVLGDVAAAVDWDKKRPGARADRVGVTGHCWGGSTVYQVAATNPDIKAAAAWYGPLARPFLDTPNPVTGFDVAKDIKAPFLGLYGEKDTNPTPDDAKKFGELLRQTNRNSEIVIYPNVGHGFFADYRPSYNAEAAADAWKRCTGLFAKSLKA